MSEIERREGSVTARDIVAAVIDTLALHDVPLMPRAKGIVARKAKELLEAGFAAEIVLTAALTSIRRGEPQVMDFIAQDIALAQAGQHLTRKEYDAEIAKAKAALDPVRTRQREMLENALAMQKERRR